MREIKRCENRVLKRSFVDALLLFSFYLSGCAALMYQTSWQRILYGVIGVDTDSITVIVSIFMLGIGLGGMLGGFVADKYPNIRVSLYALIEFGIAIYGAMSLWLLGGVEAALVYYSTGSNIVSVIACAFFMLVPTTLMGMTLPLLTMAFNIGRSSIGVSVGQLYFSNTLGAATGAGLVPFFLFHHLTIDQVIKCAVLGNILVAVFALFSIYMAKTSILKSDEKN